MISDTELNSIAIFLGSLMMGLIVLYHFMAVNSGEKAGSSARGVSAATRGGGAVGVR